MFQTRLPIPRHECQVYQVYQENLNLRTKIRAQNPQHEQIVKPFAERVFATKLLISPDLIFFLSDFLYVTEL